MTAGIPYQHETELNNVLERCNAVRLAPVPDADSLPKGFSGTLGHFPVYFPEEIAHAAGLLPINVLGGAPFDLLGLKMGEGPMLDLVRALLRALEFEPGERRLAELGPPQKTMQIDRRGRTLRITTSLLIQGSCGISRPFTVACTGASDSGGASSTNGSTPHGSIAMSTPSTVSSPAPMRSGRRSRSSADGHRAGRTPGPG